ncbi:MAG TPA: GspE/PulE family protein, partial [Afifellaceae bacterium]|nr:GspE/PulE family protein [Afifellaceae bacterium]
MAFLPHGGEEAFLAFLAGENVLEPPAIERARVARQRSAQPLEIILLELGLLSEEQLAQAQARHLGLRLATKSELPVLPLFEQELSRDFLRAISAIPIAADERRVVVATAQPLNSGSIAAIGFQLDRNVEACVMVRSEWMDAFAHLYGTVEAEVGEAAPRGGETAEFANDDLERLKDIAREAPIIRLVNRLIVEAVTSGASDIHFEPLADRVRIRIRVDGALRNAEFMTPSIFSGVCTRIKILAQMDIAERRLPQDGRIKMSVKGREVDLRVASMPTLHGESLVLRILDRARVELAYSALGFVAGEIAIIEELTTHPNGIVLVTGPTGSGKTTTLYAALTALNRDDRKIFTVEDPIEFHLPGIIQIQTKSSIGLDFASALRSILRQDPDMVMVGEIRDAEVGRVAIQAALTGHLVLSTVHTNRAASAVTRLVDMGLDKFLIAATVRGVVAQRLVRKVCRACAVPDEEALPLLSSMGAELDSAMDGDSAGPLQAKGCDRCGGTGYAGRTTICEIARVDRSIRELILA